jgi:hypothetical protein
LGGRLDGGAKVVDASGPIPSHPCSGSGSERSARADVSEERDLIEEALSDASKLGRRVSLKSIRAHRTRFNISFALTHSSARSRLASIPYPRARPLRRCRAVGSCSRTGSCFSVRTQRLETVNSRTRCKKHRAVNFYRKGVDARLIQVVSLVKHDNGCPVEP